MKPLALQPLPIMQVPPVRLSDFVDNWINDLDVSDETKLSYRKGLTIFFDWYYPSNEYPRRKNILEFKKHLTEQFSANTTAAYLTTSTFIL